VFFLSAALPHPFIQSDTPLLGREVESEVFVFESGFEESVSVT